MQLWLWYKTGHMHVIKSQNNKQKIKLKQQNIMQLLMGIEDHR